MSLQNVPGQSRAKRFLKQLIRRGHVPHALLFSGMAGIGKLAVAREFAKVLNCQNLQDEDCCDRCTSCRKIHEGLHPDVIWVESEGTIIKVGQIRSLQERLRFRPFEGRWRVVVIQDTQNLRDEAGNAFLKLLEEPPKNNLFLLLVLEPQMLLPTIVSRCCHLRFQPLKDTWIEEQLIHLHNISPSTAKQLVLLAEGSFERARRLLETDRLTHWQKILKQVRKLNEFPIIDLLLLTARWAKESEDLEQDLECIKLWVRDLLLSRLVGEYHSILQPDGGSQEVFSTVPLENLFRLYNQIEQSLQHLRQNANKQLTLEGVCLAVKEDLYGQSSWGSLPKNR
jgi:DNA polymerase-3 subunit delta'